MQKINTMEVTSEIIWGLKPPFTVNLVHLVRSVCSDQYNRYTRYSGNSVQPVHSVNSIQPVFSITGSNSCRRRRTLWRRLYFIHQGTQHLFWWHWRYPQSIINRGRGSKKWLGCTKLWNRVSSWWKMLTNAYMTIFLLYSRAGQSESLWIGAGRPPRLMSVCLIYHSRRKALRSSSWKLRSINLVDQIWFQLEFSVTLPQNSPLYSLPFSNNLTIQELCHLLGSLPTFVYLLKGLQSCPLKKLQTSVSNIPFI